MSQNYNFHTDVRAAYFPYHIEEVEPGFHVIVNRGYSPIGMNPYPDVREWMDYHPHMVKIRGLTPAIAKKLSYKGSDNTKSIYLYSGSSDPTKDPKDFAAYLERLAILAKLKVSYDIPKSLQKPIKPVASAVTEKSAINPVRAKVIKAKIVPIQSEKILVPEGWNIQQRFHRFTAMMRGRRN
jgi:hypothetical protein